MNKELVKHPSHYNHEGRKECWDEMIDIFGECSTAIFDCLSAYKYLYRAGTKDGNPSEQDMAKIQQYTEHCEKVLSQMNPSAYKSLADITYYRLRRILDSK